MEKRTNSLVKDNRFSLFSLSLSVLYVCVLIETSFSLSLLLLLSYDRFLVLLVFHSIVDVKALPSMASATGDNALHNKKLVNSSESPPLPLPLPSANDGRSHAEWLQNMLKYEQYYRICQLQIQKQQTSPGTMSANASGGSRSKGSVGSSGSSTSSSNSSTAAGSSVVEQKKSKHMSERKSMTGSSINSTSESGNGHHKKTAPFNKDLGRKV